MNPIKLNTGEQLDPQAVRLMRAIRQKESGGNYGAVGDAGTSKGAFQFQDATWKRYAKETLGDENAPQDRGNQNKVTYTKIKKWKDEGWSPEEIAAAWNAGEGKARNGAWRTNVGTTTINGKSIRYDTPTYVKDVINYAKKFKAEEGVVDQAVQQNTPEPQPGILKSIGDALISSEKNFGESIAGAIGAGGTQRQLDTINKDNQDVWAEQIATIKKLKAEGKDTTKAEQYLSEAIGRPLTELQDIIPSVNKTAGQIYGEGAGVLLDATTGGTLGNSAKSFALAQKGLKGAEVASDLNKANKAVSLAKNVGKGAAIGYGYDVTQGLQEGQGAESFTPGIGTIVGGSLPILGRGLSKGATALSKGSRLAKFESEADQAIKTILQDKTGDSFEAGKRVLTNIGKDEAKNIKTFEDAVKFTDDKIEALSKKQDEVLATDSKIRSLDELEYKHKVGNDTVTHNYVKDAIEQLDNFYTKTNNIEGKTKLSQLVQKAETQGLTTQEVNNLAREHGRVLTGFNANGELATGLSKQASENTRKGIKATVRNNLNDPVSKAIDSQITDLARARDQFTAMSQAVNKLRDKIQKRGLFKTAGVYAAKTIDLITGGFLKGIVEGILPRGEGTKVLNALDIEKFMSKNIEKLQELSNSGATNAELEKQIAEFFSKVSDTKKPTLLLPAGKPKSSVLFATEKGKISSDLQEALDINAVESGKTKTTKKKGRPKMSLPTFDRYDRDSELPTIR